MPIAKLIHNPKAGDKDHSKETLIALIENEGFECDYASFKEDGWEHIAPGTDLLVIVGGDGTVRRVAKTLIYDNLPCPYLVGLLPLGTANNIAKTLGIHGEMADIVRCWHDEQTKTFDIAILNDLPKKNFFMEGLGYGIFPQLMEEMKKVDKKQLDTPEKEIKKALEVLRDIVKTYKATHCSITVDGATHEGDFILAEVMNIRSIGPNLILSPDADPADGYFEVALLPADERLPFMDYLKKLIDNPGRPPYSYKSFKGKNIKINWEGTLLHADDELIQLNRHTELNIKIQPSALKFLVP
ncbi:diacylglycerol/lipid kinase family protein [Mucilaginibacter limnophilus]|nr:diacylglycerol kinase family protein [Mucilaginibacter limnophilus]